MEIFENIVVNIFVGNILSKCLWGISLVVVFCFFIIVMDEEVVKEF